MWARSSSTPAFASIRQPPRVRMMAGTSGRADRDVPADHHDATRGDGSQPGVFLDSVGRTGSGLPGRPRKFAIGWHITAFLARDCRLITKGPRADGLFWPKKEPRFGWTMAGHENGPVCPPGGQKRLDSLLIQKLF